MGAARAKLTEGEVGGTLVRLTVPMLLAILTMVAFNLVDTYFVGQLGKLELAAMGFTLPVVMLIASLSQGLGVGASAVIARAIGEGDFNQVQRLATDSSFLALVIVVTLSTIGLLTIDPLFAVLGATDEVMPFLREYMTIWYFALMVVVVPMVGNAAIRATGDMVTPAVIMFIAVAVNIVLDPILIFGWGPVPAMGISGAAIATLVARAVALVTSMYVLIWREKMFTLDFPGIRAILASWGKILFVGIPAAGTSMLVPISTGIVTGMIAVYGAEAVAAYGVGSRVEMLALAVIMALAGTLTPFIAQNWGAGRMDRVRKAIGYAVVFAIAWGLTFFVMAATFRGGIAAIFNDDESVRAVIRLFLLIVPVSYAGQGILLVASSALNALNRPIHATVLMAVRLFVLYIPLALVLSNANGLSGIFVAAAIANFGVGIAAWFWLNHVLDREDKPKKRKIAPEPESIVVGSGD
jgi:putative MATE family efflux protein